jgi:phosphatidylglycerophosphate synthase
VTAPTAADFRRRNRGGGLFTESVNQPLASYLCVLANRVGAPPTVLTLLNLVIGLGTSIAVIALAPYLRSGSVPAVVVGPAALVLWQLAYTLDCADGQLARVTGRSSPAGARIDVLCDVALQISLVTAVSMVAAAYHRTPVWLVAAFAGTWTVNLVTSVMHQGGMGQSLVASRSPLVRVVKLVRDYGAVVTVLALSIAFVPRWTVWLMAAFTAVNGLMLLASIAATARVSLRSADPDETAVTAAADTGVGA